MARLTNALIIACSLLIPFLTKAQDIHMSQIHASPTVINPAMNGIINDGDIRLVALSRSQWTDFGNGFNSFAGSADMKLKSLGNGSVLGGGLLFYGDRAGDLDLTTTSLGLSFSVAKSFDRKGDNLVAFGFQNAFVRKGIDYSKMEGGEQELFLSLPNNNHTYWDFTAGAAWFHRFSRHNSMYLGTSLAHVNRPNVGFLSEFNSNRPGESEILLFRKISFHGGANIYTGKKVTLLPSFILSDQGPHREIVMGSYVKYNKNRRSYRNSKMSLYLGGWLRYYVETDISGVDALVASVRIDVKKTFISFSYDINLSSLKVASNGRGGMEVSVIHIIKSNRNTLKNNRVMCPISF